VLKSRWISAKRALNRPARASDAGTKARLACKDSKLFERSREIARSMMNIELSEDPSYMDNFMAALFFPHTRAEMFPSIHLALYGNL